MARTRNIENWKPDWVALRILDFGRKVHEFGDDDKALAAWVRKMSEDLIFNNASDEFTQSLIYDATEKYCKKAKAGRAGGIAKARRTRRTAPGRGNSPDASTNGLEEYYDQETASDNYQVPDKTSTNNGDEARREAADGETDGNVAAARTTVSKPLAFDMPGLDKDRQTAKTRDSRGSGRHQPPSLSPEDGTIDNPATDGNIREDFLNIHDGSNAAALESATSAAGDSFDEEALVSQRPGEGRKTLPAGSSHPAGNTPPQFVINHNQRHRPQKPQANSPPRSSEDVRLFALDRNLDIDDARMWYQMNFVDRPGCDKDGVAINNWKGHCTAYCKAEAERRKAG